MSLRTANERIFKIERGPTDGGRGSDLGVISTTRCSHRRRPEVGPPPSSARSGPAATRENRALAGSLVAVLSRRKVLPSLLLAHRRQREADPPPGLAAWQESPCEPRPGGVPRWDPRNRVGPHRP